MRLILALVLTAALVLLAPANTQINNSTTQDTKVQAVHAEVPRKEPTDHTDTNVGIIEEKAQTDQPVVVEPENVVATPEPVKVQEPAPQPNTPEAWMQAVGIPVNEREAVLYVLSQESGLCPTKWEGEYGPCPAYHGVPQDDTTGYGLCQSTPANKMASAGDDWATNPITQLRWCNEHAKGYGGWIASAEFKRCTGWCYSSRIASTVFKHTPYW